MSERGWGGKREGAGRPPGEHPPMETVTVRFTKEQLAWLIAQHDSFSVTLRALVQRAMDSGADQTKNSFSVTLRPPRQPAIDSEVDPTNKRLES